MAAVAVIGIGIYAFVQYRTVQGAAVLTEPSLPPMTVAGHKAKPFSLSTRQGTISDATFAGTPYLLEIFATWCPHCQHETTVLKKIRARYPEAQLHMLSVTGSPLAANATPDNMVAENQDDVDAFDAAYGVTWPVAFDKDLAVAHSWGLRGFPTIYIVDRRGNIVYSRSGEIPLNDLEAAIKKAGA